MLLPLPVDPDLVSLTDPLKNRGLCVWVQGASGGLVIRTV